jgi:Rieske Fe-S protein
MNEDCKSCMNRRDFLLVSLAAAAAAGCQTIGGGSGSTAATTYDAGPAAQYSADGVYSNFRDVGFFIIRRGGTLEALSSICTHRQCKLEAQPDHSFYCPCHGSEFDPSGRVTDGPAVVNLPVYESHIDTAGHLIVTVRGAA